MHVFKCPVFVAGVLTLADIVLHIEYLKAVLTLAFASITCHRCDAKELSTPFKAYASII